MAHALQLSDRTSGRVLPISLFEVGDPILDRVLILQHMIDDHEDGMPTISTLSYVSDAVSRAGGARRGDCL